MFKKIAIILVLFSYLLTNTAMHQLVKIPVLLQHYAEHKKADKGINWFGFLAMHYGKHGSSPQNNKDYDKDMQLPFKSGSCCIKTIMVADHHSSHFYTTQVSSVLFFVPAISFGLYKSSYYQSALKTKIFQPPKWVA